MPDDVAKGFRITGSLPETGVFNKKLAKDVVGGRLLQWLSDLSQDVWNALKAKVTSQAAGDQDDWSRREVLKLTLEEVKQGWTSGPFAEQELDDRLGRGWVPSHRFGLVSAGKFRLIDDFSGSLVNATVTCKEQG